jgi:hypothetical protein
MALIAGPRPPCKPTGGRENYTVSGIDSPSHAVTASSLGAANTTPGLSLVVATRYRC